jgi:hypothetical protein
MQMSLSDGSDRGAELLDEIYPSTDPLHALLLMQSAEGWFTWDKSLDAVTLNGRAWNAASLRAEIAALVSSFKPALRDQVVATALTLRALQECFADQHEQWKLAAKKANRWLAKVAPGVKAWLEQKAST